MQKNVNITLIRAAHNKIATTCIQLYVATTTCIQFITKLILKLITGSVTPITAIVSTMSTQR